YIKSVIMVRTIAIPQNNSYNIAIPNSYIGKKIEILVYALDEIAEEKTITPQKTMADFLGSICDDTAADLHKHLEEGRNGWEQRLNKQS
ncbi:MAG: hypothetical protein NW207_07450, partial [Cytophagales bacterium]|nr:hypothetical protein [Cytophagales bacterium]